MMRTNFDYAIVLFITYLAFSWFLFEILTRSQFFVTWIMLTLIVLLVITIELIQTGGH